MFIATLICLGVVCAVSMCTLVIAAKNAPIIDVPDPEPDSRRAIAREFADVRRHRTSYFFN